MVICTSITNTLCNQNICDKGSDGIKISLHNPEAHTFNRFNIPNQKYFLEI